MKLAQIFEKQYPFGSALPLRRPEDRVIANELFRWTTTAFGATAPVPEVLVVDHEKMQWAAQRAKHHTMSGGQVWGWYSMEFPDKVFISSRLNISTSDFAKGTLVHEYTHYLQDNTDKHADKRPYTEDDVDFLEQEADQLMSKYTQGAF